MICDIAFLWITKDKTKLPEDACPLPEVNSKFYLQHIIDTAKEAKKYGHDTYLFVDKGSMTEGQYQTLQKLLHNSDVIVKEIENPVNIEQDIIQPTLRNLDRYEQRSLRNDQVTHFAEKIDLDKLLVCKQLLSINNDKRGVLMIDCNTDLYFPIDIPSNVEFAMLDFDGRKTTPENSVFFCRNSNIIEEIRQSSLRDMNSKESSYELTYDTMCNKFQSLLQSNKTKIQYLQNQQNPFVRKPTDFCCKTNESSWREHASIIYYQYHQAKQKLSQSKERSLAL